VVALGVLDAIGLKGGTAGDGDDRQGGGLGGKPPRLFIFVAGALAFGIGGRI
jgi:hypothetical protein